jgi:AcrR family transcriptional regulator
MSPAARGGRGARDRIMKTAVDLFARDGINATGIAMLTDTAHVSTRTLYQHFPSKDALVGAYLEYLEADLDGPIGIEAVLNRDDLSPRERLAGLFADPASSNAVVRGCPFHNTAVELAGAIPEAAKFVERHKTRFAKRLIETAAEAEARDPDVLGRQLAIVFEGARALATSLNSTRPFNDARVLAEMLIDQATNHAVPVPQR